MSKTAHEDRAAEPLSGDALQVELSDLRHPEGDLAHPIHFPAHPPSAMHRGQRWRQASVIATIATALLVIGVTFYGPNLAGYFAPQPVPPLALLPQRAGISCLIDAAWSPDGASVALLGDVDPVCGEGSTPGQITIYDARSGRLVASFHPAVDVILAATQALVRRVSPSFAARPASSLSGMIQIQYGHVLWSPDESELALTFSVTPLDNALSSWDVALPDGEPAAPIGILLQHGDGSQAHALAGLGSLYTTDSNQGVWDLRAGDLVAAPAPLSLVDPSSSLPPALQYTWQPDGTLAPQMPLHWLTAPPPVPPEAIGSPVGGGTFSIWQPGFALPIYAPASGSINRLAGVYAWQTSIAAWSPDRRYLLIWSGQVGLLALPERAPLTLRDVNTFTLGSPWILPVRDAGMLRVLTAVNRLPIGLDGEALAWRPDGRVIAAFDAWAQSPVPVRLYNCASGRLVATLATQAGSAPDGQALPGKGDLLRWSPDGTRLLLFDAHMGRVILWGPVQLPV